MSGNERELIFLVHVCDPFVGHNYFEKSTVFTRQRPDGVRDVNSSLSQLRWWGGSASSHVLLCHKTVHMTTKTSQTWYCSVTINQ